MISIYEVMSEQNKVRLKKAAKIGAGVAGAAAYANKDDLGRLTRKITNNETVKDHIIKFGEKIMNHGGLGPSINNFRNMEIKLRH
jgi:hypothetical protein